MMIPHAVEVCKSTSTQLAGATAGEGPVQPPTSNTGVRCTEVEAPSAILDWLAYTVPADTSLGEMFPGAGVLDWVELDHGGAGYKSMLKCGHLTVYRNGRPDQGQHVVISGQGCRELEAAGAVGDRGCGSWSEFLNLVLAAGAKFTRLDLAIDERSGVLDLHALKAARRRRDFVSRWRRGRDQESWQSNLDEEGLTLNWGARTSSICLRLYDKRVERLAAGETLTDPRPWVRVELEAHDERAMAMAEELAAGVQVGQLAAGVLRYYLQYKVPNPLDSNRRRWAMLPMWATFLANVEPIRLSIQPVARTLDKVKLWLEKYCSAMFATVVASEGGNLDALNWLVMVGAGRMKPRHWALIASPT